MVFFFWLNFFIVELVSCGNEIFCLLFLIHWRISTAYFMVETGCDRCFNHWWCSDSDDLWLKIFAFIPNSFISLV